MYYETPESYVIKNNDVLTTSGDRWETELDPFIEEG